MKIIEHTTPSDETVKTVCLKLFIIVIKFISVSVIIIIIILSHRIQVT